jgi:hypothetical protein
MAVRWMRTRWIPRANVEDVTSGARHATIDEGAAR